MRLPSVFWRECANFNVHVLYQGNVNKEDLEFRRIDYDRAMAFLRAVRSGRKSGVMIYSGEGTLLYLNN